MVHVPDRGLDYAILDTYRVKTQTKMTSLQKSLPQALLKSGSLFYVDYVKKNIKKKKIPYRPTLFLFDMQQ